MKIALIGYGKMGKLIEKCAKEQGHTICHIFTSTSTDYSPLQEADMAIDFSHASATLSTLKACLKYNTSLVIGTTGWQDDLPQVQALCQDAPIGVLFLPNYSPGMLHFFKLIELAGALYNTYDTALIETHHKEKKDAPSGTALYLASLLQQPCPIEALRLGTKPGTHTLLFDSPFDTITLTHEAKSKQGFGIGAIDAAEWLQGKRGFHTHMSSSVNFDTKEKEGRLLDHQLEVNL